MSLTSSLLKYILLTLYYIGLVIGYAVFSLNNCNQIIRMSKKLRICTFILLGQNSLQSLGVVVCITVMIKIVAARQLIGIETHIPSFLWVCFASMLLNVFFYLQVNKRREFCLLFQQCQRLYTNVSELVQRDLLNRKHLFILLILIIDRIIVTAMSLYLTITDFMREGSLFSVYSIYVGTVHNTTVRLFEIGHILSEICLDAVCERICEVLVSNANTWQTKKIPLDPEQYERILSCRFYLVQVYKVKTELSKHFSPCTFLYYVLTFLDLLMSFYSYFNKQYSTTTHPSGYIFFVLFLVRVHLFAHTVEMTRNTYGRAVEGVFSIASKRRSPMMNDEYLLQIFSKIIADFKDAFGLFKLSRALTFSMFAAVMSYIIILVQFNLTTKL